MALLRPIGYRSILVGFYGVTPDTLVAARNVFGGNGRTVVGIDTAAAGIILNHYLRLLLVRLDTFQNGKNLT